LRLFILTFQFRPRFIWSYMELLFSRTKECFDYSLICQLITAYVNNVAIHMIVLPQGMKYVFPFLPFAFLSLFEKTN